MLIVTGGSGFIGTNLLCYLRQTTDERIVSIDWRNPPFRLENVCYDERDIANKMDISGTYPTEISTIYHLAAQAGVNCKHKDAVHSNILGTIKVAEFAIQTGAHLVFASSGAVKAVGGDGPPDSEYSNTSGYGISKLAGEKWLQTMIVREGLSASILRLSNVYGWQPTAKSVVANFVQAALKEDEAKIAGSGLQTRDLIHVYDVVHAMVAASKKRFCGVPIDVCTGNQVTIRELWQQVKLESEIKDFLPVHFVDGFTGPPFSVASSYGAKEFLDWRPEFDLEGGLTTTVEFWKLRNQGHGPKLINNCWHSCIEKKWHSLISQSGWDDLKKQLSPSSGD